MTKGDLVHIPQGTVLGDAKMFFKVLQVNEPSVGLFWDNPYKDPKWGLVYFKNRFWSIRMRDIYPIEEENNVNPLN
jgi:hypothetical protein